MLGSQKSKKSVQTAAFGNVRHERIEILGVQVVRITAYAVVGDGYRFKPFFLRREHVVLDTALPVGVYRMSVIIPVEHIVIISHIAAFVNELREFYAI